jgi:hypothetical protein
MIISFGTNSEYEVRRSFHINICSLVKAKRTNPFIGNGTTKTTRKRKTTKHE